MPMPSLINLATGDISKAPTKTLPDFQSRGDLVTFLVCKQRIVAVFTNCIVGIGPDSKQLNNKK
jgi:hypothetical protein